MITIDVLMLVNNDALAAEAEINVKENFGAVVQRLYGARSIAHGYNELAKKSTADILCFMHQDARVGFPLGVLETYFEGLENPGVLGFCGTTHQIPGKQWWECPITYGGLTQGRGADAKPLNFTTPEWCTARGKMMFQPVQTLDGYCLFIKREVFEAVGGFDEGYDGWHGYDIDICTRVDAAGYRNYVIHQRSQHFSWGAAGPELIRALERYKEKWSTRVDVKAIPVARKIDAPERPKKGRLKICVYTICKNELQFVERFAKSCEDADGVYVLDTGSTDGTPDALVAKGINVEVVPFDGWKTLEEYDALVAAGKNPWRFDTARNLSMDMVPDDADVLVCIDLDEVLVPNWRKLIEDVWVGDINHLSYYFAWSMTEPYPNGVPRHAFWYEKFHSRKGYVWVSPVHEAIVTTHDFVDRRAFLPVVMVKHYPDSSKSRAQYLQLLELCVREAPNDPRVRFYLGREYLYNGRHVDAINSHKHLLDMPNAKTTRERSNACLQIASCYGKFKADAVTIKDENNEIKNDRKQFYWLMRAAYEEPGQREAWVELADYARIKGDNLLGYWASKKALAIPVGHCDNNYLVDPDCWKQKPHDIASICAWWAFNPNQREESLQHAWDALANSPWDGRLEANYRLIQNLLAKPSDAKVVDVDVVILSYSKTAKEYEMTKSAIRSLRESSPSVGMCFVVVETNEKLADEPFTQADKGKLFGEFVEVCYPPKPFGFNKFLKAGFMQLTEGHPCKYVVLMNNDVTLFNPGFMGHMVKGMESVPSASPLGLREATWGLVNRTVPIDENYDINRSVNGWFLMFDRRILNAIPFEKLFPEEFTWYGGDIHYAQTLEKCGYKHGLINAAQALHLQQQSHPLREGGFSPPADRNEMLKIVGVKDGRCVEVGVELGVYSKTILENDPKTLMLVDPWCHQDEKVYPNDTSNVDDNEAERRFAAVKEKFKDDPRVTICRAFSVQASKMFDAGDLDFVYIDAIHTYEACLEDMNVWWPKVKKGGWMCGHDYHFRGVIDAVKAFCAKENVKLAFSTRDHGAPSWAIHK